MARENVRGRYSTVSNRAVSRSVLKCPDCNEPYIVYRSIKKKRRYRTGHVKDLWCFKCEEEKKFIQLPPNEAKYNY